MRVRPLAMIVVLVVALAGCMPLPPAAPPAASSGMPLNMASHGMVFGAQGAIDPTPAAVEEPVPTAPVDGVTNIVLYTDPMCSHCRDLVATNGELLVDLLLAGQMTIEVHPIAILDESNDGSSTRLAAAFVALADEQPETAFEFVYAWMSREIEPDVTHPVYDEEIVEAAEAVGVATPTFEQHVLDGTFEDFVGMATDWATEHPVDAAGDPVSSTPTVIIDGDRYEGLPDDAEAFAAFVDEHS